MGIVFNSSTTDGLDFLAAQFISLTSEDEIILFVQEHHATILPWQHLRAMIRIIHVTEVGDCRGNDFGLKLSERMKNRTNGTRSWSALYY
jgi:selenocysteine lyase/cysteine desulfurase